MRGHKGSLNWPISGQKEPGRQPHITSKDTKIGCESAFCANARDACADVEETTKFGMKTNRANAGRNRERELSFSEIALSGEPNYRQWTV
jgi:hypothetical protein